VDLFFLLAWRDFLVRYRTLVFGVAWAVFRPLGMSFVLLLVFGYSLRLAENLYVYFLLIYAGWLVWQFFSSTVSEMSQSLSSNAHLIGRARFSLIVLPMATSVLNVLDFIIALVIGTFLSLYTHGHLEIRFLLILPCFLMMYSITVGTGLLVCALQTRFRDLACLQPLWMQALFCLAPIGYSLKMIPQDIQGILWFHPLAPVMEGIRFALLPNHTCSLEVFMMGLIWSVVSLTAGFFVFQANLDANKERLA